MDNGGETAFAVFLFIIYVAIILISIASIWKIFTKAGKPGWASIIPIYNIIVMLEVTEQPLWMIILYFIPFASLVVGIIITIELSNRFGKSGGFTIGLILLPIIFYPILAFGDSIYQPRVTTST